MLSYCPYIDALSFITVIFKVKVELQTIRHPLDLSNNVCPNANPSHLWHLGPISLRIEVRV